MIKLTDICTPKQWKTLSSSDLLKSGYPVYGANGIIGYWNVYNHKDPTVLITCRGATCGSVNLSKPFSYINGNAMCLDNVSDNYDVKFLFHYLSWYDFSNIITGSAQPQITRQSLSKVYIPLIDKKKQQDIVHDLTVIERALINRQQALSILNHLVKSRFVEMFGDPVTNPMGWKVTTVGQVTTDVRYGTSAKANDDGQYKYLRMNNLTYDGYLDLSDLKHIDVSDEELEKCVVRKGDVLFNRTNSTELVGKTALFDLDEDMVIAGYIIRVRLHDIVSPVFFTRFMNMEFMKKQLRSMAKGAVNQANINAQELKAIAIYVPPIELQNEFADFVEQNDKSKLAVQQSIDTLQTLKDKLMQDYFG